MPEPTPDLIAIRRAGPDDAATLAVLATRIFRATFAETNSAEDMAAYLAATFSPTRQLAEIEAPGARTLLAIGPGEAPIAFAQLRLGAVPECVATPDPVEIWRFYVDHAWHGRGVARTLMHATLAEAAALGGRSAWLGVWEHNHRALAFYRRLGFVEVGAHPFVLGSDVQTDLVLALRTLPI